MFVPPTHENDVAFYVDVETKGPSPTRTRQYFNPRVTKGRAVVRQGALAPEEPEEPEEDVATATAKRGGWDVRRWRCKTAAWRGGRLTSVGVRVCPWLGTFATVVLDVRVGWIRVFEEVP